MTDCNKPDCCEGKKVESTLEVKAIASLHDEVVNKDMAMEDAPLKELLDEQESDDAREDEG